jgi:membrane-bound serine protease (ClpP class)
MPLLGLGLFYVLPLGWALPLYGSVLLLSGALYLLIYRAHSQPVACGKESMVGRQAEVVESFQGQGRIRYQNVLWKARCPERLVSGERVTIKEVRGMTILVEKEAPAGLGATTAPKAACHSQGH